MQHPDELLDICHVQADGGLVEHVQRAAAACSLRVESDPTFGQLRELGDQLDALRLAAGERRALLPEREVTEAHVLQQGKRVMDPPMRGEEVDGFVDVHRKHVGDRFAAPRCGERLAGEARSVAGFADDLDVGQKAHLDRLDSLALAFRAATAGGIEREAARAESAHARLVGLRVQAPDRVPESHVGRRTGARRPADRRLVDLEHAVEPLPAGEIGAAEEFHGLPPARVSDQLEQIRVEHIARERALAAARHAGDHGESLERNACSDVVEVVQPGAGHRDRGAPLAGDARRHERMGERMREEPAGDRVR